jgi:glucose-6-phosphate-specific signal transduction histidine kinase
MILLQHLVFFFLAVFAGYGYSLDRHSKSLRLLVLVLPTFTVAWLNGWGLLTCVAGLFAGIVLYASQRHKQQRDRLGKD